MTKKELKQYLIDEAGKSPSQVEKMGSFELFNAWLTWNDIWGFTRDIIEVYKAAFDNKNYLTFDNLSFRPHSWSKTARQACVTFNNGYEVSVLFGNDFYSDGKSTYEVACMKNGNVYYPKGTSFEHDVVGYVTKEEVTNLMKEIQDLPKCTD